jgi:3',5'-cyclic AMP phosphodiesterase CpdA
MSLGPIDDSTAETEPGPLFARLAHPTSRTRTRIALVADAHLSPTASGTWKVYHRSETRFRTAVGAVNDVDPDLTLLLGDLTRDGRPDEFACVREALAEFDHPWVALPGNHDVPKRWDDYETPTVESFAERYADGSFPFVRRAGDVEVVGLDTASGDGSLTDTHEGAVPDGHLEWLDEALSPGRTTVVGLHHTLFHPRRHAGGFPEGDSYQLRNAEAVRGVLTDNDVSLVVSGHLHWPATARRDGLREVVAPATCSFPQAAMLLDVGPLGTDVHLLPLAGPEGTAEAYALARSGNAHGQSVAAHADREGLTDLPVVDERRGDQAVGGPGVGDDVPGAVRWR